MPTPETPTQHTPGPWAVGKTSPDMPAGTVTVRDENGAGWDIAQCLGQHASANARLIAAAPELLAALRDMLAYSEFNDNMSCALVRAEDAARAAIAKAEGRDA